MPLSEVSNSVDGGSLLLAPTTVDANDAPAPSVRFVVYLLQTSLYSMSTTNRPSGFLSLTVHVYNRQLSVSVAMCFQYLPTLDTWWLYLAYSACDIVDFAWGSVARSISVSRYTCGIWVTSVIRKETPLREHYFNWRHTSLCCILSIAIRL